MIETFGTGASQLTGPLIDGYVLRQTFVAEGDSLSAVHLLLSTYKRNNTGKLMAEIVDSRNVVVASDFTGAFDIADNEYHRFKLKAALVPGKTYEFRIRTLHCRSGQAPTAHHSEMKHVGANLFILGRLARGRELVCRMEYGTNSPSMLSLHEKATARDKEVVEFLSETEDKVSVIILNKNHPELIAKCVTLVMQTMCSPYEVIIGDTGSTDEEVLEFYESLPPDVKVVRGLDYHFSKNNNLLASQATGSLLLFLNNDVFLEPDCVRSMTRYMRVFSVGAVGLRLLKPRGAIDHDGQFVFGKDGGIVSPGHLNINVPPQRVGDEDAVVDGVTGACMLTRKNLFLKHGGFSEEYADVYQDCDYCLNLKADGYSCVTVRKRSAVHIGSATRGTETSAKEVAQADNARFRKKWSDFAWPASPRLSVVTCCNNPESYIEMMGTVTARHSEEAEMVPVRNNDNLFTVTQALNFARSVSRGQVFVYCHQDVKFPEGWISEMDTCLRNVKPDTIGVVGFEGVMADRRPLSCRHFKTGSRMETQTLDELCLIAFSRDLAFDESFKFHYYGADLCLQAIAKGLKNYVVSPHVLHMSSGKENILKDQDGFKSEALVFREKWKCDVFTTTTNFTEGGIRFLILPDLLNGSP